MPRVRLEETKDWQLADRSHDVRGRELRDSVGRALGTIKTMIVDTDARRVESVVLEDGNEYPVRDLQIMEQAVYFIPSGATESAPAPVSPAPDEARPAYVAPEASYEPSIPAPAPDAHEPSHEPLVTDAPEAAEPAPEATPRFTWQPAAPSEATPPVSAWDRESVAPTDAGWSPPTSGDEPPAPPALDAIPDEPAATSPYAPPPTYSAPAYNPPAAPPPYVAPALSDQPAMEAQREEYTEAVTPPETLAEMEAPAVPPPAAPETYTAGPSVYPPAPPAADPLADPYAPPATYAEPTHEGDFEAPRYPEGEETAEGTAEETAEETESFETDAATGPPPLRDEGSDVFAPGLEAGGLATGAFGLTPAPGPDESRSDYGAQGEFAGSDVRPAEPFTAGGTPVVAPAEPGHAPGSYGGIAPEPGFPTHAAPAEAAAHHTFHETPAARPADEAYREHFAAHYAQGGGAYDDLAGAYRFGADAATDPELRDADDDTLRRRFNLRNGYPEDDRWAWLGARGAVLFGREQG